MDNIKTAHGDIKLPAFMPDATYGSIKTISFPDLEKTGIETIVTTTLHLEQKVGSEYIKKFGGIHKFFGWQNPILTDSGGWQVFSLINAQAKKGKKISKNVITDLGCSFVDPASGNYSLLTPESSINIQLNLGSDIVTALDNPVVRDASLSERKESVRITTNWAKRGIQQFRKNNLEPKTLIGCVIQGADDFKLRKQSAEELLELDFNLYNFGGIPLYSAETWKTKSRSGFYKEMLQFVSELIPAGKVKYAMGVGQPNDIAYCIDQGWNLFDTVLPTRNARHGYLYVSQEQGEDVKSYKSNRLQKLLSYSILRLRNEKYKFDEKPVDENCKCECCTTVSRAYLRHLIRIKEPAGQRLATIHNLTFYSNWLEQFR